MFSLFGMSGRRRRGGRSARDQNLAQHGIEAGAQRFAVSAMFQGPAQLVGGLWRDARQGGDGGGQLVPQRIQASSGRRQGFALRPFVRQGFAAVPSRIPAPLRARSAFLIRARHMTGGGNKIRQLRAVSRFGTAQSAGRGLRRTRATRPLQVRAVTIHGKTAAPALLSRFGRQAGDPGGGVNRPANMRREWRGGRGLPL